MIRRPAGLPASAGVLFELGYCDKVCNLVAPPFLLFGVKVGLGCGVRFPGVRPFGFGNKVAGESSPGLADCSVHLAEVETDYLAVHPHFEFEVGPGSFKGLGESETISADKSPGGVHNGSEIRLFHNAMD